MRGKGRYLWDWLDEKGNVIGGNYRAKEKHGKNDMGAGGRLRSQRDTRSQNKSKILVYGVAGNFRGADNGCGGRVGDVVRRFPGWKKSRKQKQKK